MGTKACTSPHNPRHHQASTRSLTCMYEGCALVEFGVRPCASCWCCRRRCDIYECGALPLVIHCAACALPIRGASCAARRWCVSLDSGARSADFLSVALTRRQRRQVRGQCRLCVPCLAGSWAQPPLFKTQCFFTQNANKPATTLYNVEALKAALTEAQQLRYTHRR